VRRADDFRALSRTSSNGTPHRSVSHGPAVAPAFFYVPEWGRRDLVNREQFYAAMSGEGTLYYELYLNTKTLLSCQSKFEDLCNGDELQFQLVHQIEELWMKLIAYTLLDIDEFLQHENTHRVVTLFRRVHMAQRLMIQQVALLETMSPKEYQATPARFHSPAASGFPGTPWVTWKRAGV